MQPSFSYASSSDPRVHVGLGSSTSVDGVEVVWPDKTTESFEIPGIDRVITLRRSSGKVVPR